MLLSCGPPEHGIVQFADDLATAAAGQGFTGTLHHEDQPAQLTRLVDRLPTGVRLVHLQVNDHLFADKAIRAEDRIEEFADLLRRVGAQLSVTLHDLPQQAVTADLFRRRALTYLRIVGDVVGVAVSSEHERTLLREAAAVLGIAALTGDLPSLEEVEVIPLPVPPPPAVRPATATPTPATVGILGFIYPGKGHREVIDELAGSDRPVRVTAIGRPSDGHLHMLGELAESGERQGISFSCTGYVPDRALPRWLRDVAVPVAPHPQVSASASINSWIGAGRRPLVLAGRYTHELERRMPGSVRLYEPGQLREKVRESLERPSLTWLGAGFHATPNRDEVAAHYLRWLRAMASRPNRPLGHR